MTGSRIASASYTSNSPLVAVGAAQIAATGQVSLDSAIGQMPQFSASQGHSEVGDVQGSTGFEGGQSYSDLRGLGPQRTLVLLDGQRLVPTNPNGAVDLNVIPMAMIEGVDVITGRRLGGVRLRCHGGRRQFPPAPTFPGHPGFAAARRQHPRRRPGERRQRPDGRQLRRQARQRGPRSGIQRARRNYRRQPVVLLEYRDHGSRRAAPPEGIFNAGELGGAIPITAVNGVLAGYPGTTPLTGTGNYGGYLGINNDGSLFTSRDPGNCVQNYRGPVGQTPGLHITPDCTTVKSYLGPYFAIQVPMRRYNLFSRVSYDLNDNLQAYGQINFMHSYAQDLQGPSYIGPGKYFYIPQNNPFVTGNAALQTILAARANPSAGPLKMEDWLTALGPRIESFNYNDYQATGGLKGTIGSTESRLECVWILRPDAVRQRPGEQHQHSGDREHPVRHRQL